MPTYCPVCGQPRAVRKDGTIRLHQKGPHDRHACDGSHRPPIVKATGYVWAPGQDRTIRIEPRP